MGNAFAYSILSSSSNAVKLMAFKVIVHFKGFIVIHIYLDTIFIFCYKHILINFQWFVMGNLAYGNQDSLCCNIPQYNQSNRHSLRNKALYIWCF